MPFEQASWPVPQPPHCKADAAAAALSSHFVDFWAMTARAPCISMSAWCAHKGHPV